MSCLMRQSMAGLIGLVLALLGDNAYAFRTSLDAAQPIGEKEPAVWQGHATHFRIQADGVPGVGISAVGDAAGEAFETWTSPACAALSVSYFGVDLGPAVPGDQVNTIQWLTSGWAKNGRPKEAPAATDVQYQETEQGEWEIVEADIYLNAEHFRWTAGEPTGDEKSILAVLTHEVGHFLGLLHPCELDGSDGAPRCSSDSEFKRSALYPAYSASSVELSQDDRAGICFLYPAPDCEEEGCGEGKVCTKDGCLVECGDEVCPDGSWCETGRCVDADTACPGGNCPCEEDAACPEGQSCEGGVCRVVRAAGALADPCSDSEECASDTCHPDGYCSVSCAVGSSCPQGFVCEEQGAISMCTASSALGVFGDPCEDGQDCASGYCVSRTGGQSLCTRTCIPGGPACPEGWVCGAVDGREVCRAPFYELAGGGCAFARRHPAGLTWILTGLGALITVRRFKRSQGRTAVRRLHSRAQSLVREQKHDWRTNDDEQNNLGWNAGSGNPGRVRVRHNREALGPPVG